MGPTGPPGSPGSQVMLVFNSCILIFGVLLIYWRGNN
jgi:hypothetical protein